MTNTTAAAYPLIMFRRLRHYAPSSEHGIFAGYPESVNSGGATRAAWVRLLETYVEAAPGLYELVTPKKWDTHLEASSGAPLPDLDSLAAELQRDFAAQDVKPIWTIPGPATMELLATCLIKGNQEGTYGNSYWSNLDDTVHILSCGFDWTVFRGVSAGRWDEFNGTFAEDSHTDVLEARMTCRCDDEVEVAFGMSLPSLSDLIVTLEKKQLQKLFGE